MVVLLCLGLLGAMLPAVAAATAEDAPRAKAREYIVTLSVADSDRLIRPSSRSARERIERRVKRAGAATERLARAVGFEARHRYGNGLTGFSAVLTEEQAAEVARQANVASVRPARKVRLANQVVPTGVRRVKADPASGPVPDLGGVNIAVIDTGIAPFDASELNIVGSVNCFDDRNGKPIPETATDFNGHGTHVAGVIGARDNGIGTVGVAPGARLWAVRAWGSQQWTTETAILCGLQWAVDTHRNDTPDIDVINMSFEVSRLDYLEDCGVIRASGDSDPMHRLVCDAHDLGITMVAAAGNGRTNANSVAPGGFDQVISVGALVDLDGAGGSEATSGRCGFYGKGWDDTYASDFSNRGREVDIVAPGECIESTASTGLGKPTEFMTGTSQAAPHVTGAIARYLAEHPGTDPERMRRLIRASGRLDWQARSDPYWAGVNDPDPPHRVLDVQALTGGEMLKTWVFHSGFKMGRGDTTRTTRVDLQRGGGFGGPAELEVSGLPRSVGTATFTKPTLTGLGELGTKMRIELVPGGDDGILDVGVGAGAPGISPFFRSLKLTVDRRGPVIADLSARIRGGHASVTTSGGAQAFLAWDASDAVTGVKSSWLQRKTGTKPWRKAGTPTNAGARVTLKPGQANRFRVKATDRLGNRSTSKVLKAKLVVLDTASSRVAQPASGGWATKKVRKAYGGSLMLANDATESIRTSFSGVAAAVVASVGPNRGSFRVRIDGGEWTTVSLRRDKAGHRKVVWSRQLDAGSHVLEIQGLEGRSALDAVLFVRQ